MDSQVEQALDEMKARNTRVLRAEPVRAEEVTEYRDWLAGEARQQANAAQRVADLMPGESRASEVFAAHAQTLRDAAEGWPPAPAYGALQAQARAQLDQEQLRDLEAGSVAGLARAASLEAAITRAPDAPAGEALAAWREKCVALRVAGQPIYEPDMAFTSELQARMSPEQQTDYLTGRISQQLIDMQWPSPPASSIDVPAAAREYAEVEHEVQGPDFTLER